MRKICFALILFMLLCFFVSNLFCINIKSDALKDKDMVIKLLLTETGEVIELSLDDYIKGVLVGEVPATYEDEAIKAQAIVARTYTLYKLYNSSYAHENADMCDDVNHCQAYKSKEYAFKCWEDEAETKWNKIENAVKSTSDQVIKYKGNLINAFFHAHSGGMTEDVKFVWGREEIPYLKSVESNEGYDYADRVVYTKNDFFDILKNKYQDFDVSLNNYSIDEFTSSGRVDKMTICNKTLLGTEIRSLFGLRSTYFSLEEDGENMVFTTKGYGHGVGMSQEGANYMALQGKKCEDIIKHYYTDVSIDGI